ncbi:ATP-dependent RNA helicase DHX33-like [Eriocheir sinensis]|uniref:ATP-dependent RNA helicase DHX33-like n=1 Tax=Eriocheir sinensis TaxID=95602 RepID=UPI0021C5C682|nr:ATP-dependent RNA helicase DHX33-like [Eriocheir sinensis]XP_050726309.1 ATP-dependent RNA helicase DHX33-like [Eriocheir sinensis]
MAGFREPPPKKPKPDGNEFNTNSSHIPVQASPSRSANGHVKPRADSSSPTGNLKHKGPGGGGGPSHNPNRNPEQLRNLLNQRHALPIFPARAKLLEELKKHQTVIVIGETGSGKTTQIPQYIHEERLDRRGAICVTQPRRVAAISIAKRVAEEMDTNLGGLVGYSVRFEEAVCPATKVKYVTDGMLLREAISDPLLSRYSWVVLDEAHERTINTDVLFGIVKDAQKARKSNPGQESLKLIIMSATMDVDHFSKYFDNCQVLYVEGRQHPIEMFYTKKQQDDYVMTAMTTVFQIHRVAPPQHDILVFLTGQEEIDSVTASLRQIAKDPSLSDCPRMRVLALYAALPANQQLDVFRATAEGERKVIVSTNIAETSITIPGIRYVVDSGRAKIRTYHAGSGFDALKVKKISQAQAWQRAGRAGREAPGNCYRAYTREEFEALDANPTPEILRSNLASVILQLLAMGLKNVLSFDFIDKPSTTNIDTAVVQLTFLGAVVTKGDTLELTETGRKMAQFPLEPRYAKVILSGPEHGCTDEVLTIISALSSESIFVNPSGKKEAAANARRKFTSVEGDHITLLKIFRAFKAAKKNKMWCHENFLNFRNLNYACEVRKQLAQVCQRCGVAIASCQQKTDSVRRCLAMGLFTNVAELQLDGKYLTLDTKQEAALHPTSALFGGKPAYVLFTELVHTGKAYMHLNSIVDPEWLYEIAPEYFRKKHIKR